MAIKMIRKVFSKSVFLFFLIIIISSCNNSVNDKSNYINAYYEILLVRESIPDTAAANPKVMQIIKKYGYDSESEFRNFSLKLYNDDPKGFTQIIDSIRKKAETEMIKLQAAEKAEKDKIKQDSVKLAASKMDSLKAENPKSKTKNKPVRK